MAAAAAAAAAAAGHVSHLQPAIVLYMNVLDFCSKKEVSAVCDFWAASISARLPSCVVFPNNLVKLERRVHKCEKEAEHGGAQYSDGKKIRS